MKILVIVPAYNEEESIASVIENLRQYPQYDFVIIDDGSKDKTAEICHSMGANLIDLPSNLGIGGAVQTGYIYAMSHGYDAAVQFDGDGQHDANYISKLIDGLNDSAANLVIGSRFVSDNEEGFQSTFMRRVGIRIVSFFINLSAGVKICDPTSGFRIADKKAIAFFCNNYPADYPEPESIVSFKTSGGGKIAEVPVVMHERQGGSSSIKAFSSVVYMLKVVLAIVIRGSHK